MEYIGKLEDDKKLYQNKKGIVIFGAGKELCRLLGKMEESEIQDRILCICDNDPQRQGGKMAGIAVVSPEYAFIHYNEAVYIVYNRFCAEISRQLVKMGIKNIHLLRG